MPSMVCLPVPSSTSATAAGCWPNCASATVFSIPAILLSDKARSCTSSALVAGSTLNVLSSEASACALSLRPS